MYGEKRKEKRKRREINENETERWRCAGKVEAKCHIVRDEIAFSAFFGEIGIWSGRHTPCDSLRPGQLATLTHSLALSLAQKSYLFSPSFFSSSVPQVIHQVSLCPFTVSVQWDTRKEMLTVKSSCCVAARLVRLVVTLVSFRTRKLCFNPSHPKFLSHSSPPSPMYLASQIISSSRLFYIIIYSDTLGVIVIQ